MARHNPQMRVLTLDMPLDQTVYATSLTIGADDAVYFRPADACGEAFRDTPEAASITQLWGDSATFDFSPYAGGVDLVYVDFDRPIHHVLGTRMAIYSRQDVVSRRDPKYPFLRP